MKLETLQTTDPNNFWNLSKELKTGGKTVCNCLQFIQTVCNSSNKEKTKPRNKLNLDQLNKPFNLEEIKQGIKKFKSKKVPGIDCILSEMIKCSIDALLSKIT